MTVNRSHFEPEFDVAGYRFRYLTRRDVPLEERQSVDLIDDCDFDPKNSAYAREHLLFASLYQARNTDWPRAPVHTVCTLTVPQQAQLAVSIGYRRPAAVTPNASVTAEIWLADGKERDQLLSEIIPVLREEGWTSPIATEYHVDLAKYAGRDVTLVFRATFRGRVRMASLDHGGFALVWHDPRIETR